MRADLYRLHKTPGGLALNRPGSIRISPDLKFKVLDKLEAGNATNNTVSSRPQRTPLKSDTADASHLKTKKCRLIRTQFEPGIPCTITGLLKGLLVRF